MIRDLAERTIRGDFGNGQERRKMKLIDNQDIQKDIIGKWFNWKRENLKLNKI